MPTAPDVLIAGGGIRGAALAYYLARAGVRVLLCERDRLAAGPSGQDSALVNATLKTPAAYTYLSALATQAHRRLAHELDPPVELDTRGNLPLVAWDAAGVARLHARVAELRQIDGLYPAVLDSEQLRVLEPAASSAIHAALYGPEDARVNARALTHALANAAVRHGARVREGATVQDLAVQNGRVERVRVNGRWLMAGQVVLATGRTVPELAARVGVTVPLVVCRGQIVITEPQPPLLRRPLSVLQQDRAGRVYIGSGNDFANLQRAPDHEQAERQLDYARRLVPALATARIAQIWVELRPWPLDGQPILGPVPGLANLWLDTGHSGITLAPLTGHALAEWITTGKAPPPVTPFTLERFERAEYAFAMHQYCQLMAAARPTGE